MTGKPQEQHLGQTKYLEKSSFDNFMLEMTKKIDEMINKWQGFF